MGVSIDISEAEIQNGIAVALAESFGPEKREALLRDVIRAHLSVKADRYDKETLLNKTIGTLIRKIANEQVEARINELRPEIEAIVTRQLGAGFKSSLLDQLEMSLKHKVVSDVHITAVLDDA